MAWSRKAEQLRNITELSPKTQTEDVLFDGY